MQYLKAITAAVITGLGTLQVAYSDNLVTNAEWIGIAIATLVALGGVWAVPNLPRLNASWGTGPRKDDPQGPTGPQA
jgi:hypothetical protein